MDDAITPKYVLYPARGEHIDRIVSGVAELHSSAIESTCPPAPGTNASKTSIGRSCTHITHRVVSVARYLWLMVLIAFVVLMVSSTLLVANTIRLSIFARRREIEVMKLVGATNWFVRGPFMIEGLLCGLAGAVVAIVLLMIGKAVILPSIGTLHTGSEPVKALAFEVNALVLVGV